MREGDPQARILELAAAAFERRDREVRKLVAVGICSEASMWRASAAAPPCAAGRPRGPARPCGGEHVALGDPAAGAAACNGGEVDALDRRGACRDRGGVVPVGGLRGAGVAASEDAGVRRAARCGGRSAGGDSRDHLTDGDGVALGDQQLGNGAARRRGKLDVDLVGRDLDDRLVDGDRVADLDVPFEDRALGDRLAGAGRDDIDELAAVGGGRVGRGVAIGRGSVLRLGLVCDGDPGDHLADGDGVALGDEQLD